MPDPENIMFFTQEIFKALIPPAILATAYYAFESYRLGKINQKEIQKMQWQLDDSAESIKDLEGCLNYHSENWANSEIRATTRDISELARFKDSSSDITPKTYKNITQNLPYFQNKELEKLLNSGFSKSPHTPRQYRISKHPELN